MSWRPIETAPRTGNFLAYDPEWGDEPAVSTGNIYYGMQVCYYSISGDLCSSVAEKLLQDEDDMPDQLFKPTHWMPLPEAPEVTT